MRSQFEYLRPGSLDDAIRLNRECGDGATYWGGGTDLVLQWKAGKREISHCIDLTALRDLSYMQDSDEALQIGAMTTLSDLEAADERDPRLAVLARTARLMCTVQTRTIATIGGNICNASPAADLIPPLIALDAEILAMGADGERRFPVADLMTGPGKTCLQPSEIVVEIAIPKDRTLMAGSYRRIDRTVVDISLVGAASAIKLNGGDTIASAGIALGAVAPRVVSAPQAEEMLVGKALCDLDDELLKSIAEAAAASASPISDIRASAAYRSAMIKVLVVRTLIDNRENLKRRLA
jgi:carbon-monoxide dehydrogenase medium subunit